MDKISIYRYLLRLFKEHPEGLSFKEIHDKWEEEWARIYGEGEFPELTKRTFHRYKQDIQKVFEVIIYSEKGSGTEDNKYKYFAHRLKDIEIKMLMLGDPLSQAGLTGGSMSYRILAEKKAVVWMRNLLTHIKQHMTKNTYKEEENPDGGILFQFEAPYTEFVARSMLPYADIIEVKSPFALAQKIEELLKVALSKIQSQKR